MTAFKLPKLTDRNKILLGFSAIAAGLLYWSYKAGKLDSLLGANSASPNVIPPPFPVLGPGDNRASSTSPLHKFMTSPSSSPAHKAILGKVPVIPPPIAMGKAAAQQIQGTLEQHQQAQQLAMDQQQLAAQHASPTYGGPPSLAPTFGDWVHSNEQTSGWWR